MNDTRFLRFSQDGKFSQPDDDIGEGASATADVVVGVDQRGVDGRWRLLLPALGERQQRPAGTTGRSVSGRCPSRTFTHSVSIRRVRPVLRGRRRSVCMSVLSV